MPAADKKVSKKGTKLSLTKKTQKTEDSSLHRNNGIRNLLEGKVDLNETCEFQQPLRFPGCRENRVKTENDKKSVTVTEITKVTDEHCEEREESVKCQVCNKNLSHMNVRRREQHVNKCIDKVEVVEKQQKEEQVLLEAARTAVLDCPMCGQHFKAENARLVHLKKCSQNVGVSTEKMIQLVKEQEQERQQQLAAGIVPKELRSKVTKSVAPKKRKLKEPKSQFEEDVQVAMAISSSLTSAGDNAKNGKRKKNKKAVLEDVCLLTTLTDEDRQRRMEEKVSNILHMASNTKYTEELLLLESSMKAESQHKGISLWERCSQDPGTCDNEQFYVGALVPPLSVSKSVPGTNLRRLSSIPGRETSFAKKNDTFPEKCSDLSADDIITASTQTAVVLAELATDDTDILDTTVGLQLTPDPHNTDHISELQASGFCVEKMVLNKDEQDTQISQALYDYRRMINKKEYSDVTVISCNGQSFFAHQIILAARCPKLLQMMKDSAVKLEILPDSVLSFLNYIYTGDVTLTSSSQTELLKLAQNLQLPSLVEACNKVVLQTISSETVNLNDNSEASKTEFVESHLDMKEIWGESDSDLDLDKGDHSGGKESRSDSGINDDDYREICCTQNRKIRERISQGAGDVRQSDSKSKHLIDDLSQNSGANELNEIQNKLTSYHSAEEGCETRSLRMLNLREKEKDEFTVHNESPEVENDCEVMEVDLEKERDDNDEILEVEIDSDVSPSPKKLRLSDETEDVKNRVDLEINLNELISASIKNSAHEENGDFNGFNNSLKQENDIIDVDEDNGENTNTGINSSTADLFSSPSPRKPDVTIAGTVSGKIENSSSKNLQSISKFSTPLEYKSDSKRTLNTSTLPITPVVSVDVDSDSSLEVLADQNENTSNYGNKDQIENAEEIVSVNSSLDESSEQIASNVDSQKEIVDSDSDKVNENGLDADRAKTELNFESSDDDLQITGDNLDELTQQSPTFKHHKTNRGINKIHNPNQTVDETKYLGLKSFTEGFSHQKQFCDDNGYVEGHLKFSRNVKHKRFADSASDSEEIVTIQTEDSDMSDNDEGEVKDIDSVVTEADNIQSSSKACNNYSDNKESDLTSGSVRDGRKSTAYGKHEVSVYSGDEDNAYNQNSSFGASNTGVWEDFDDCGMGYEPLDISAGETSPAAGYEPQVGSPEVNTTLIGYEQQEECPGEMSPVIPNQDEVIDLSQNEDDNNIHDNQNDSDLDGALLEDGDDSFVFKVNDHQQASETPSAKTLETEELNFKTPAAVEKLEKKGQWVPPSPFTPMPQYGGMPTPALKKAVQKYGVKPVGKKRMIKVLEDIYHQTHQYETDSECEVEDDTHTDTVQTGGGASDSLPSSQGDISSQDSDISDVLEESCLHTMSSDSDTTGSPQKNIDVTRQLFGFIKSHPEIHMKILMYEPLELDVLKKDVKGAGIKCSMDKLMDFLDERCIAFTSKNSRKRQTGRRGKQKATKSKQTEI
ncbi:structure-specific endonuclease subunit SLX4-like [Mercenaria mercenaria]|uniref:structure-specific endonuclease subunit SLX4-like n=1 Tax=Mercenaria mercenaria TaxID=6596 RepID=UPI00234E733D|nr:structure-specific endonuclease subunit SLX4-like [Mercenaria mercenaria]